MTNSNQKISLRLALIKIIIYTNIFVITYKYALKKFKV